MSTRRITASLLVVAVGLLQMLVPSTGGLAESRRVLRIPVSRSEVVSVNEDVRTVAIADPRIADAAMGSARTVIVTAKATGVTTLVVYNPSGAYTMYDVESYVPNADLQVLLHVRVAEVSDEAKRELGFDWFGNGTTSNGSHIEGGLFTAKVTNPIAPLAVGSKADGLASFTNGPGDFFLHGAWKALEEKGAVRVLANPALMARSGEKASFLAGGEFPVPIASGAGVGGLETITIEWKEYGIRVDFTPTIAADSTILLKVAPEVSALDFTNAVVLSGYTVPSVVTRRASTTVSLKGGEHLVIGGLHQTDRTRSVKRIPVLGSLPWIGALFSSTSTDSLSRELVIVVSPELIQSAATVMPALPTDAPSKDTGHDRH
jgi:pilus assembly protein CpaC